MNVGGTDGKIKFGSITPVAAEGVDLSWNIVVQYLFNDGRNDPDNEFTWDGEQWLDANYDPANDVEIDAGKGLWVGNGSGGAAVTFRSAGQVNENDIAYPLNAGGATPAANGFPCTITYGDITPVADPGVDLSWNIVVQYLFNDGRNDPDNEFTWDGEQWLDANYDPANEVMINPGQGLWVGNGAGGNAVTLQFAAPEL